MKAAKAFVLKRLTFGNKVMRIIKCGNCGNVWKSQKKTKIRQCYFCHCRLKFKRLF